MIITMISILSLIFLVIGMFALLDLFLRFSIIKNNKKADCLNNILFYSDVVEKKPNSTLYFRFYTVGAKLFASANCNLNNMGYFSSYNYSYEKKINEFRILVLGGEQTASSVVDTSWPDFLQKILNQNSSLSKVVTVINLAWPDAGPEHYLKTWETEGIKYNPDLVIINLVETDYYRYLTGAKLGYLGCQLSSLTERDVVYVSYKNKPVYFKGHIIGGKGRNLADSKLIASRPFGFFAPYEFMTDLEKVSKLQNKLAIDFIKGGLPKFNRLGIEFFKYLKKSWSDPSCKNKLKAERMGFIQRWNYRVKECFAKYDGMMSRNFDILDSARDCELYGERIINLLHEKIPNKIFIHSFNITELTHDIEYGYSNLVMKNNPDINIIDMRSRLPSNLNLSITNEWYLSPYLGEKWSLKGHEAYAALVANLLIDESVLGKFVKNEEVLV